MELQHTAASKKNSKEPQLIDLTNVVRDEMTLVNDPLYLRDAVGKYVERPPRHKEKSVRKSCNAMATVTDNFCNVLQDKSNKAASKVEVFEKDYVRFMEEIISKVYARKSTRDAAPEKIWYLHHHGVYHPNKTGKIKVVLKVIWTRPYNQIADDLLRFRVAIAVEVMGEIEAMFHQVKIPNDQCSFLRFLWWDDCDTKKEIMDYQMAAHVSGGASPLSCFTFSLRKIASDNRSEYASDVTRILERYFYEDDILNSFQTFTKAKDVILKVK